MRLASRRRAGTCDAGHTSLGGLAVGAGRAFQTCRRSVLRQLGSLLSQLISLGQMMLLRRRLAALLRPH